MKEIVISAMINNEMFLPITKDFGHLEDLFLRLSKNMKTQGTQKLVITLTQDTEIKIPFGATKLLNIVEYRKECNLKKYTTLDVNERKEYLWDILFTAYKDCAIEFNWDNNSLNQIYSTGIELGLKNIYSFLDNLANPNRSVFVSVVNSFEIDFFETIIIFKTRDGATIKSVKLFHEDVEFGEYFKHHFKKYKWTSLEEFTLFHVNGQKYSVSV